jgi:hypothetical protein
MALTISHLAFTDDSLMFVNANGDHGAKEITLILNSYCQALGEHINLAKSSILFSKGCPNPNTDEVKHILNVPNESLSKNI